MLATVRKQSKPGLELELDEGKEREGKRETHKEGTGKTQQGKHKRGKKNIICGLSVGGVGVAVSSRSFFCWLGWHPNPHFDSI